jgi:hypothetical protein
MNKLKKTDKKSNQKINSKKPNSSISNKIKTNEIKKEEKIEHNKTNISNTTNQSDTLSLKEAIILILGIVFIFSAFIIIPRLINQQANRPLTLNELHLENYDKQPTESNYIYSGFSFIKIPDPRTNVEFWYWQYQDNNKIYDIPMRLGPKEVDYINWNIIEPIPDRDFDAIYITIEPEEEFTNRPYLTLAISELTEKFNKVKSFLMIGACTKNETNACKDRPIITCESTEDYLILYFKENTEPELIVNKNCIIVKGTNETLLHSTHNLIYRMLGVI